MTSRSLRGLLFVTLALGLTAPTTSEAQELCWRLIPGNGGSPVLRAQFIPVNFGTAMFNVNARLRTSNVQFLGSGTSTPHYPTAPGTATFFDLGLHLVHGVPGTVSPDDNNPDNGRTCDFHAVVDVSIPTGVDGRWYIQCSAGCNVQPAGGSCPGANITPPISLKGDLELLACVPPASEQAPTTDLPGF